MSKNDVWKGGWVWLAREWCCAVDVSELGRKAGKHQTGSVGSAERAPDARQRVCIF